MDLVFDTFFKENIAKRDFRSEKNRKKSPEYPSTFENNRELPVQVRSKSIVNRGNYESKEKLNLKEWKKNMVSENTIQNWGI